MGIGTSHTLPLTGLGEVRNRDSCMSRAVKIETTPRLPAVPCACTTAATNSKAGAEYARACLCRQTRFH